MPRFFFKFQLYNIVYTNITSTILRLRGQVPSNILLTKSATFNQLYQDEGTTIFFF